MKVVIWTPFPFKACFLDNRNFIVETFIVLAKEQLSSNFYFLTTTHLSDLPASNIQSIIIEDTPSNGILKKLWSVKLARRIKKMKVDLLVSLDIPPSLPDGIPLCIILNGTEKLKQSYLKKAASIIVLSKAAKEDLIKKMKLPGERISVIYPSPGNFYKPFNLETKQSIKSEYSDGNEFFLYNGSFAEKENFINLLKSFSHFKKRQKSNLQLLISTDSNTFFQKSLEGYKYRNDVKFTNLKKEEELSLVTAAAYAVVLPFGTNNNVLAALNAMRSGVPVITTKESSISEVASDAALYSETSSPKEIGDKLMEIYTNEDRRSRLIERGKAIAASFTPQKSAVSLWQAIMKAVQ